jgi:hypothetical protein
MLVSGAEQHPFIVSEDILGSIAVMHIKIQDSHPAQAVALQCMCGCNRDVVYKAEPHRIRPACMMTRRPHRTENGLSLPLHDSVHAQNSGPSCKQGGLKCLGIH